MRAMVDTREKTLEDTIVQQQQLTRQLLAAGHQVMRKAEVTLQRITDQLTAYQGAQQQSIEQQASYQGTIPRGSDLS